MIDIGLLILRVVLGLTFMGHGAQKLFGLFGGSGMQGTRGMMERMRMRPPWFWAIIAALCEFGGGLLVFLGFLDPVGSLGIMAAMLVAMVQVHWAKGFWNTKGGIEFPLMNFTAALALALTGPGKYSLDALLRTAFPEPLSIAIGLLLVILGVIVGEVSRAQPVQTNKV